VLGHHSKNTEVKGRQHDLPCPPIHRSLRLHQAMDEEFGTHGSEIFNRVDTSCQ